MIRKTATNKSITTHNSLYRYIGIIGLNRSATKPKIQLQLSFSYLYANQVRYADVPKTTQRSNVKNSYAHPSSIAKRRKITDMSITMFLFTFLFILVILKLYHDLRNTHQKSNDYTNQIHANEKSHKLPSVKATRPLRGRFHQLNELFGHVRNPRY